MIQTEEFKPGRVYDRQEIHKKLGGGLRDFLPHSNGKIVCGCFTKKANPLAPAEVLPGNGPNIMRWAEAFYDQQEAVPVFLKKATRQWEYMGLWKPVAKEVSSERVQQRRLEVGRPDITMILHLELIN